MSRHETSRRREFRESGKPLSRVRSGPLHGGGGAVAVAPFARPIWAFSYQSAGGDGQSLELARGGTPALPPATAFAPNL